MMVTGLKLANLRAIEAAEFRFQPGFNLIVGINGVGKTTVLDALRICMSRVLPGISPSRARAISFDDGDIRAGFPFLDASMHLDIGGEEFRFTRLEWRERVATDDPANLERLRRQILETERLRDRARNLLRELERSQSLLDSDAYAPAKSELRRAAGRLETPALAVFYSTNRSVLSLKRSKGKAAGGQVAAYADALVSRSWEISHLADWMRAQAVLASESDVAQRHTSAMQAAVTHFLPECSEVRAGDGHNPGLSVKKAGDVLDLRQLSDGERGILSIALDLAQRLCQANPHLADPLGQGRATVLIDEIDLHLHPKWQRQIVHNLTVGFPQCQFIATTHSPQVIGEVPHERIQIIADRLVYSPTHSFGVDSSRVLQEVMEVDSRTKKVQELLDSISHAIGQQKFVAARELVSTLAGQLELGERDAEVTRLRTLLDFMEGKD